MKSICSYCGKKTLNLSQHFLQRCERLGNAEVGTEDHYREWEFINSWVKNGEEFVGETCILNFGMNGRKFYLDD